MKLANTLQNPFVLVVQGFALGTILVFANPLSADAAQAAPPAQAAQGPGAETGAVL